MSNTNAGKSATSCKMMITVPGKEASSQLQPLYTVPIQTTATLNIHLTHQNGNTNSTSQVGAQQTDPASSEFKAHHVSSSGSSSRPLLGGSKEDVNMKQDSSYDSSSIGGSSLSIWRGPDVSNDDQIITVDMNDAYDSATEDSKSSNGGDSDTEIDVNSLELNATKNKSTFNYIAWDELNPSEKEEQGHSRVLVMKETDTVLMFKASCESERTGNDSRLLSLMVDIADNCIKRLHKMKGMTLPKICPQHMDTLPLSDGRTTRCHLDEISKVLRKTVTLTDIAFRFQPEDVYIGTFVQGTVSAKRNYAIGKVGVVAVLAKKSKYATVEAFSEQLCEHIAISQPASLGYVSEADIKRINKRGTMKIVHLQKDQLVLQNFTFDPTIIVAEAARRSFVKIEDFLLFK